MKDLLTRHAAANSTPSMSAEPSGASPAQETSGEPSSGSTDAPPTATIGTPGMAATGEFTTASSGPRHVEEHPTGRRLAILSLTALGVVYGDIGTSPLYALKQCFGRASGIVPTVPNVYGVLSLVVWSLTLIVTVKYIYFIMHADNNGEGGILALLALVHQNVRKKGAKRRIMLLTAVGLFGAALLYGDGVITPAITVLGAVEGLEVATPLFSRFVVPASVLILATLFFFEKKGTDRIGRVFGPIMLLWFLSIGAAGLVEIAREPAILRAINPAYAVRFFLENGTPGFFILGSVVLVVTGAEALYADMGHFGRRPIRVAWGLVVFPTLLVNYFGQGALLLRDPTAAANPFYRLFPQTMLYPMVALATAAAVIASQALISGAYSITQQAMQLGYSPRMTVTHTSKLEAGQIYIREVNAALAVGCIALVIGFRSSGALASAYGIAVTGTMAITTMLFADIARYRWHWSWARVGAFLAFFLTIDLSFLIANAVKVEHGGWVPLAVAGAVYLFMTTWKMGRAALHSLLAEAGLPIDLFLDDVRRRKPPRVPGTAVFMTSDPLGAPVVLLHHLKHNKVLHEQVLLLSIITLDMPEVPASERLIVRPLGEGFYRVVARYGFMQTPNVPEIMAACRPLGVRSKPSDTSYFLGREHLIPTGHAKLPRWRKQLFVLMARNARSATEFFGLPPNRVVELGAQIEF
ncbi:MAG TPA: potassium transporter Kup [Gemmatimonadaceae bacterium]|nr:potassium transporter Kup [Gemmatimonadaceae bacterium]